jgi:phosphoribosylpyrophosphate synthetase
MNGLAQKQEFDELLKNKITPKTFMGSYSTGHHLNDWYTYVIEVANILKSRIPAEKNIIIWATGASGIILATMLATQFSLTRTFIQRVSKEGEQYHEWCESELNYDDAYHIVIDDCVATGQTLDRLLGEFTKYTTNKTKEIYYAIDCLIIGSFKAYITEYHYSAFTAPKIKLLIGH